MTNKPKPPDETYVDRAEREISALRRLFKQNSIIGLIVLLVLSVIGAKELGFFEKKDRNEAVLKWATNYAELSKQYIQLQTENQQRKDAQKDAEIAKLQAERDAAKAMLEAAGEKANTSTRVPSQAVDTYLTCVHQTTSTATILGGLISASGQIDSCKTILQKSISPAD